MGKSLALLGFTGRVAVWIKRIGEPCVLEACSGKKSKKVKKGVNSAFGFCGFGVAISSGSGYILSVSWAWYLSCHEPGMREGKYLFDP